MVTYKVITYRGADPAPFEKEVQAFLDLGWQLHGNLSVVPSDGLAFTLVFVQVLLNYKS